MSRRSSLACAFILLTLAILDSHSTYLAVRRGSVELNPIVAFFLLNDAAYAAFCIVKCLFYFLIGLDFKPTKTSMLIYAVIAVVTARAVVVNYMNASM